LLLYRLPLEVGTIFIVYLSREHVARCYLFYPFVDCSFELCNNWLCTSLDVEAGFNYPLSEKDIYIYVQIHTNNYEFRFVKMTYNLEWRKYIHLSNSGVVQKRALTF
jgi:hypothetical protein